MSPAPLSLVHLIRTAKTDAEQPAPLFMFHGYGSNEEDLFSFAAELPEELFVISVRAPYELEMFGNAWYAINFDAEHGKWSDDEQAKKSRDEIVAFIAEACEAYNLNTDNVTLLGFSQGTILSYAVALSHPDMVKNVIALSGYINEQILAQNFEGNNFSNLGVYASHGQVDQVIPLEWAQRTPDILDKLGISYIYEEFPVGHGVSPQNFYSFRAWLENRLAAT